MTDPVFIGYASVDKFTVVKVYSNGTTSGDIKCKRSENGTWHIVGYYDTPKLTKQQSGNIEKIFQEYMHAILAKIIEEE
jgi:hypothetical protein